VVGEIVGERVTWASRIELVTNRQFLNELPQAETPLCVRRGHRVGIHGLTLDEVGRRIEDHLIAVLHAIADLDRRTAVADHGELADVDDAVLYSGDVETVNG
jgi:hypothetical protein